MMDTIEMVNMMDMMEKMQAFCERAGRSGDDFQILCRSLGVAPDDANDWLLREIGVDGEEYLLALNPPSGTAGPLAGCRPVSAAEYRSRRFADM